MSAKHIGPRLTVLVLVVSNMLTGGCTAPDQDNQPTPVLSQAPQSAYPMPPLKIDGELGWVFSDGSRAKLSNYRGKVLALDFYATWCEPCRQSIPHLSTLKTNYGPQGLEVVGLNVGGPDDRVKVAAFASELMINYPLGFPDQTMADLFLADNQTIPQTFLFGREGQLVKRFIGYDKSTGVELERLIQAALAEASAQDTKATSSAK